MKGDTPEIAAEALKTGRLVMLPTETVYGLAADAANPQAVARIFEAKRRALNDPLIVHVRAPELAAPDGGAEAALAAFTVNAAYAGFAEGRFGRLVKGEKADFIMVDRDPMLASAEELRAMRVIETWIGGARIYVAGAEAAQGFAQGKMPGW